MSLSYRAYCHWVATGALSDRKQIANSPRTSNIRKNCNASSAPAERRRQQATGMMMSISVYSSFRNSRITEQNLLYFASTFYDILHGTLYNGRILFIK